MLFKSFVGAANRGNVIHDNVVLRNGPADLADRDPAGTDNVFRRNTCRVSQPAGRC